MAIPVNDYAEFDRLVQKLWNKTPLFGFVLHDSRKSHRQVASFLEDSAQWLDELALQSGIYILFPLRKKSGAFTNPSPEIAKRFGLTSNRLPGIILLTTGDDPKDLPSNHFLFVPLAATDFSDVEGMESTLSELFSLVQEILDKGHRGHEALEDIRKELSRRRKNKTKQSLIQSLRKGAQIVLIKIPEKFLSAFAESFAKALGSGSIQ